MYILITEMHLAGLREVLAPLDSFAEQCQERAQYQSDRQWSLERAQAENAIGTGFVVLQTFMSTSIGVVNQKKPEALSVGPEIAASQPLALIIHECANAWKHENEEMWKENCRAVKKSARFLTLAR